MCNIIPINPVPGGFRILTLAESERRITGRVTWPQPVTWQPPVSNKLFFEIFRLNRSGNWKVSLIVKPDEPAPLDPLVTQLRTVECLFLKTVFHWKRPQGNQGTSTKAIYNKVVAGPGCQEADAKDQGFDEIRKVLDYPPGVPGPITPEWQAVLARV
jgi:hypothetical protein